MACRDDLNSGCEQLNCHVIDGVEGDLSCDTSGADDRSVAGVSAGALSTAGWNRKSSPGMLLREV